MLSMASVEPFLLVCPSNHTMEADVKGRAVFAFPFIHCSLGYLGTLSPPSHRSL